MKISSKTNSTYITEGMKLFNEFRTSDDYLFKTQKRQEVYLRGYYEAMYTLNQKGYILFDTLTLDDDHCKWAHDVFNFEVPKEHDFRCFNPGDFKKFMDRLRKYLSRRGYDVVNKIKYQFVTEYGTADYYLTPDGLMHSSTHRPHYHVLFYVTDSSLTPEFLSKSIKVCWKNGRTDGIDDQPEHFANNVFSSDSTPERLRGVTHYIAKYITKDSDYSDLIKAHSHFFEEQLLHDDAFIAQCKSDFIEKYSTKNWFVNPEAEPSVKFSKYVKRQSRKYISDRVAQYHRTSLHFGEFALSQFTKEELIEYPFMSVPDTQKVKKFIPLPMYYARKLFYTKQKHSNGKDFWTPNSDGERYLESCTWRKIKHLNDKYQTFVESFAVDSPFRLKVEDFLDGRPLIEFVNYKVLFKNLFLNYSPEDVSEIDYTVIWKAKDEGLNLDSITIVEEDELFSTAIDENSFYEFRNFDRLDRLFNAMLDEKLEIDRQIAFDFREMLVKRQKDLGFKVKKC